MSYEKFITDVRKPERIRFQNASTAGESGTANTTLETFVNIQLEDYSVLVNFLPREFELYLRGAACYHAGNFQDAIIPSKKLLELPEEMRVYRSTWAAFMIARALHKLDKPEAIAYYEFVRDLARQGVRDPLLLATESLGWQAQLETQLGLFAPALNHYMEL